MHPPGVWRCGCLFQEAYAQRTMFLNSPAGFVVQKRARCLGRSYGKGHEAASGTIPMLTTWNEKFALSDSCNIEEADR